MPELPASSAALPLDDVAEQAIDWLVRLDSGHCSGQDRAAFAQWLTTPVHASAWERVQQRVGQRIAPVANQLQVGGRGPVAVRALSAPPDHKARRRALLGTGAAAVLLASGGGLFAERRAPLVAWSADLSTGTADRRRFVLEDGSDLLLNARSAANVDFSADLRRLHLLAGALIVQVAPDAGRPFVVQSAQGTVQALGTRFMVQQDEARTLVSVLQHSVRLTPAGSGAPIDLSAGASAWMTTEGVERVAAAHADTSAWSSGVLEVHDRPLAEVLSALRPYTPAVLRASAAAARVGVYGVYQLDRPMEVLQSLVDTLPLQVRQWGDWLVYVDVRD